jgi:hypothetical protein
LGGAGVGLVSVVAILVVGAVAPVVVDGFARRPAVV